MIGEVPFFVEVNHRMPRTHGENQVHVSQVLGWCEADYPLDELPPRPMHDNDRKIAEYVAERIPDGATLQAGIGAVPNEVLTDGFMDLIENGNIMGTRKGTRRNKVVATSTLGSGRLYEFVRENPGVEY